LPFSIDIGFPRIGHSLATHCYDRYHLKAFSAAWSSIPLVTLPIEERLGKSSLFGNLHLKKIILAKIGFDI